MAEAKTNRETASRRKMALLIGNSQYQYFKKLPNAENDIEAMKNTLEKIGFTVTQQRNLNRIDMRSALVNFEKSLKRGDMVLFYFAGHGVQWEVSLLALLLMSYEDSSETKTIVRNHRNRAFIVKLILFLALLMTFDMLSVIQGILPMALETRFNYEYRKHDMNAKLYFIFRIKIF